MSAARDSALLIALEAGHVAPGAFTHENHVRAAHALLSGTEFFLAAHRYAAALRRLTQAAGAPEKFNATITFAFLSLMAEAMAERPAGEDADAFLAARPEFRTARLDARWSPERLAHPAARSIPLLPDRAPACV